LVAVSGLLLWQAVLRFGHPVPVPAAVPILVGLTAAVGNWGVARLLRDPGRNNPAIRLAYIHNLGDVQVSLAPVICGVLVMITGKPWFDPLIAAGIAIWIMASTLWEVALSRKELIWPEKINCGHSEKG
jgi:cobalt-zinc-cadmium efflux system protein